MMLWVIFGLFFILSLIAGNRLKARFREYSQIRLNSNMTGADVARKMLNEHGCNDVQVISVEGQLSDHYDPIKRTVNLSHDVFYGSHVAAAAVAAHEAGHAVQHSTGYAWLQIRTALVPIQNVTAKVMNIIFIAMLFGSFLLSNLIPWQTALVVIVACYAVFTLFAFITLPVEFDASRRALVWIAGRGIASNEAQEKAKDALKWAASTYVIAALASLATLLYYVSLLGGGSDD